MKQVESASQSTKLTHSVDAKVQQGWWPVARFRLLELGFTDLKCGKHWAPDVPSAALVGDVAHAVEDAWVARGAPQLQKAFKGMTNHSVRFDSGRKS